MVKVSRSVLLTPGELSPKVFSSSIDASKLVLWIRIPCPTILSDNMPSNSFCILYFTIMSIIVPTFLTKVWEYLCSGWVFFSSGKFRLFNYPFLTEFVSSFKRYCCLELKFEQIFHLWSFSVKLWGFEGCHSGQFGTINARYISRY